MIQFFLAALESAADKMRLNRIVDEYETEMRKYARTILGSDDRVDDVVQESFVKVIRAYDDCRWREGTALRAWLMVIVRNTALDMCRKEKRYNAMHHSVSAVAAGDDEEPLDPLTIADMQRAQNDPPDEIQDDLNYRQLTACILSMPERYSGVLEMSLVLGMSNREIAKVLQIPENTVATRLRRGRELLISELEKEGITCD